MRVAWRGLITGSVGDSEFINRWGKLKYCIRGKIKSNIIRFLFFFFPLTKDVLWGELLEVVKEIEEWISTLLVCNLTFYSRKICLWEYPSRVSWHVTASHLRFGAFLLIVTLTYSIKQWEKKGCCLYTHIYDEMKRGRIAWTLGSAFFRLT